MIPADLVVLLVELAALMGLSLGLLLAGIHARVLFSLMPPAVQRIRVIEFSQGEE